MLSLLHKLMFCPNCGIANQQENSYCRQCGMFLPDLSKGKQETSPETHLTANLTLSIMTAAISAILAFLLYKFYILAGSGSPILYATGGFLTAICCWQVQASYRTWLLKKYFKKQKAARQNVGLPAVENVANIAEVERHSTNKLLNQPDFSSVVPPSVTENSTELLDKIPVRKNH